MTVRLSGTDARGGLPVADSRLLRYRAVRLLRALGHARSELSIALVDDERIGQLNSEFRNKRGPTDVLSFSLLEGAHRERRGALLGDVVISLETAARQARRAHRAFDGELARLLIHGTLHLLGWDHERADEARAMQAEERRLWREVSG